MRIALFILTISVFVFSCRTSRNISTAMTKKDTTLVVPKPSESDSVILMRQALLKIKNRYIDFKTFSAKVKVDYADSKDRKYDFNANLRMYKDSVIWISINALLGIEAFRVLITPDSVKIQDKLNKTIQYKSLAYIQEIANLPIDFYTLQDLLIGNPVYLDSTNIVAYKEDVTEVSMLTAGKFFKHFVTFFKADFSLQHSKLDDADATRSRTADLSYDEYENSGSIRFSTKRRITIAEKGKLEIELDFKQIQFNQPLNFPFTIPKNYNLK